VCCREDGDVLQPTSLTHQFTYLMGRSPDLPRLQFHDLRHSHATQLLVEGIHPK
jgi:integrase